MEPAVTAGASAIARYRPKVILATAPPYETLKAGWTLHKRTGLPLVVDFRDPWTWGLPWNPSSEKRAREERAWEARVMADASLVLVVTPSMQRTMAEMYPEQAGKIRLLMNGYEDAGDAAAAPPADRFVLSYAGSILERRLPPALFEGLRRLRAKHPETAADVRVQLIGANHTNRPLHDRLREEDVADMVEWVGAVSPDQCRTLLRSSHVLLHMEGTAHYAISGKLFEYLSSSRQVLGLVPAGSDDEWFLTQSGGGTNAGLDDPDRVSAAIRARWEDWRANRVTPSVDPKWLGQFHRREQTRTLASLLGTVIDEAGRQGAPTSSVRPAETSDAGTPAHLPSTRPDSDRRSGTRA
jgi:glycosyltransferase involved in cell wall biosynthesis